MSIFFYYFLGIKNTNYFISVSPEEARKKKIHVQVIH